MRRGDRRLRISAGSSYGNRKVINGPAARYYLKWQSHARKRAFGWLIHVVTARDVTSVGGRRCRRRPRSWEDVSYLFGLAEVRWEQVAWKKRLTNWRRHYCCCRDPDGFGRLPVPFIGWSQKADLARLSLSSPPILRRFSLCLHPFARSYGKKNRMTEGTTKGKRWRRRRSGGKDTGDESLSIWL